MSSDPASDRVHLGPGLRDPGECPEPLVPRREEPRKLADLCANGPAAMIGDKVVGALDEAKLERVISEAGA